MQYCFVCTPVKSLWLSRGSHAVNIYVLYFGWGAAMAPTGQQILHLRLFYDTRLVRQGVLTAIRLGFIGIARTGGDC